MAGKRKNILKLKGEKQHRANVKDAIKRGLLQGNERLEFLKQPEVKEQMMDFFKRNIGKMKKQVVSNPELLKRSTMGSAPFTKAELEQGYRVLKG